MKIIIDQINEDETVLEFCVSSEKHFQKIKSLLTSLERYSHFEDGDVAPFVVQFIPLERRAKLSSKFLFKQKDQMSGSVVELLKINDICLEKAPIKKIGVSEVMSLVDPKQRKYILKTALSKLKSKLLLR